VSSDERFRLETYSPKVSRLQLVPRAFETRSMSQQVDLLSAVQSGEARHSVRPNIRLTEAGTDLITILMWFLSFKTVLTSRNIIVFKIKFPLPKTVIRVMHAFCYLVQLAARLQDTITGYIFLPRIPEILPQIYVTISEYKHNNICPGISGVNP
jgi:hypothetical protein